MNLRMIHYTKTIDQKSKPAKNLNDLPVDCRDIGFKCDGKYLYRNTASIMPFRYNIKIYCEFK